MATFCLLHLYCCHTWPDYLTTLLPGVSLRCRRQVFRGGFILNVPAAHATPVQSAPPPEASPRHTLSPSRKKQSGAGKDTADSRDLEEKDMGAGEEKALL